MVVRGRSAWKLETVVLLTNMDALRDSAAQAMLRDGWMTQEDLDQVIQDCLQEEGEDMVADDAKKGTIPVKLVARAKEEERAFFNKCLRCRGQGVAKEAPDHQDPLGCH